MDLLLSQAKGLMFREIRLYFFFVRTFWFSYHLWLQVFRLVTVYRPPPSKKNGFTVERFFSEFSALSEELTVTFCQFLLCGDFNYHVDVDSNTNAKHFSDLLFSADMSSSMRAYRDHTLELVTEMWKSRLCCEMCPNGGNCIGALWPYSISTRFVPSKRDAVAHALSRLPLPSTFNEENETRLWKPKHAARNETLKNKSCRISEATMCPTYYVHA